MQAVSYHSHIPHNITYINSKTLVAVVYKITNEGDVFNWVRHSGMFYEVIYEVI